MFKIVVISAIGQPTFLIDSALSRAQICREVARRFGYTMLAPFASSSFAMPHSWVAVDPA